MPVDHVIVNVHPVTTKAALDPAPFLNVSFKVLELPAAMPTGLGGKVSVKGR